MWKPAFLLVLGLCGSGVVADPAGTGSGRDQQAAGRRSGRCGKAEYREFLKIHPEATAIHSNLGAALAGLGRFEEAIAEYRMALKQSPSFPGARLNLGLAYYKMGRIAGRS